MISVRPLFNRLCQNRETRWRRRIGYPIRMKAATAMELCALESLDLPSVVAKAKDWAYLNGLIMRKPDEIGTVHAPLSVLPTPFPRRVFEQAVTVMPMMNKLYDAVSCDSEFLMTALEPTLALDDFMAKLMQIYKEKLNRQRDHVTLGIHRSDYMLDAPSGQLLQIEMNTMASSFGALSCQVSKLHGYLAASLNLPQYDEKHVIHNTAVHDICAAMAKAHEAMGLKDGIILMLASKTETNRYDQEWLTLTLKEQYGIDVVRAALSDIMNASTIDASNNLIINGRPVSIVYFRSGFSPRAYPSEQEWEARQRIEFSTACKCPSISYHLAGTKKIQQELTKPGTLERYLTENECRHIRPLFAGLWGLDHATDPDIQSIIHHAIREPDGYVLKPQREGGGNNLYGEDAQSLLKTGQGLAAYVLMQRIRPQSHASLLIRNEDHSISDTISELGIYGTFVKVHNQVMINNAAGHLLRTKADYLITIPTEWLFQVASSNEGGVAAGFAVLDSPYLMDD